ncbi:hypothetical protein [cyanobacterium endosymbiont of Epithemia turgida]|uniref:hypothetical protein n=1 Tax=cyanobacterium endosymbiont of Epithemia turgida TaxID=718217 RepID=UPI0004D0B876|nr:hypothetical protein [cyanobacterium endosymbiont of Epithemia turgida]BAP16942.1 hypothetical protein ETSB_0036 [cyanobacterium endosymbiont of Epithemia turgida isolate EtSB Lake Yunoko]
MLAGVRKIIATTANTIDDRNDPILIREEILLDFTERLTKNKILLELNGLIES